tara:strand:+ start:502 stop:828 length:327 start_codon:yes stop_codon:yes gene_type:complete
MEVERFSVNWFDMYDVHMIVIVDGQYLQSGTDSMAGPGWESEFEVDSAMTMDLQVFDLDEHDIREAFEAACCTQWEDRLDRIDALSEQRFLAKIAARAPFHQRGYKSL